MTATGSSYNPAYRYGEPSPVKMPWKTAVAVNTGDLVYQDSSDSNTVKPASSLTWGTAVATPSAPTVADGAHAIGTALTNAATGVKVSYQFPWGEGALSNAGSVTPTAGAAIKLSGLAIPSPAIGLNVYTETSAGSGTYALYTQYAVQPGQQGIGDQFIMGYGQGQAPPSSTVPSTALEVTQYTFAKSFAGVAAQAYDGTNGSAYGINDGNLRVDTTGVFDFACASATFNVGDYIGPAKDTGNNLYQQKVVGVSGAALAIGRVEVGGTSLTTVRVRLFGQRSSVPHL